MVIPFPKTRPTGARDPTWSSTGEVIVFPRLSTRELFRLWGYPTDRPLELGPDGRALLAREMTALTS